MMKIEDKVIDKICEKTLKELGERIVKSVKASKEAALWGKAVKKACDVTEGIDESFADYVIKSRAIQRHFIWLTSDKSLNGIYYSFVITMAVELCSFNAERRFAVSFGTAILDNWFELNGKNYQEIRKQLAGEQILNVIKDREKLYHEYFRLYDDSVAKDVIRVYYPKNGESWIRWNKDYSVDIRVNLSRGTEYGFCRIGFAYSKIEEQECERFLKVAYLKEDREIYRFENDYMLDIEAKKILWAW